MWWVVDTNTGISESMKIVTELQLCFPLVFINSTLVCSKSATQPGTSILPADRIYNASEELCEGNIQPNNQHICLDAFPFNMYPTLLGTILDPFVKGHRHRLKLHALAWHKLWWNERLFFTWGTLLDQKVE